MSVRCHVHEHRDLGRLRRMPSAWPLRPEDRKFCSCTPCAARDFIAGFRGPLTEEEQIEEERRWEREWGEAIDESGGRERGR